MKGPSARESMPMLQLWLVVEMVVSIAQRDKWAVKLVMFFVRHLDNLQDMQKFECCSCSVDFVRS